MGDITQHFSWYEVAPKYDPAKIPSNIKANIEYTVKELLEPGRVLLNKPIQITSGYRSEAHNKAVGGAKSSQHITGKAFDICTGLTGQELFDFFVANFSSVLGGIGLYHNENTKYKFIHIDTRAKVNGHITTWYFNGKQYMPLSQKQSGIFRSMGIKFI